MLAHTASASSMRPGVKQGLSSADACFERERHIVPRPIQQFRQGVGVDAVYGRVPLGREIVLRAPRRHLSASSVTLPPGGRAKPFPG